MRARQMPDPDDESIRDTAVAAEVMKFIDLADLSTDKLDMLKRAISRLLHTPRCEEVFAQIIDGRPTRPTFLRNHAEEYLDCPNISDATEPSEHAIQCYHEIKDSFDITFLKLEAKLVQAYQNITTLESSTSQLRFLEIVAACINTLGGIIYRSYHPETDLKPPRQVFDFHLSAHFYVDFYHASYKQFERHPFGLLNVVGYWAESEIFGGVLLFERGLDGSEMNNAYLHLHKRDWECTQLSQQQITQFLESMTTNSSTPPTPQPPLFIPEKDAHAVSTIHAYLDDPVQVYKNEYDRPPRSRRGKVRERGCIGTQEELWELHAAARKCFEAKGERVDW